MKHENLKLSWQVGPSTSAKRLPDEFVCAHVPGAATLDWAQAHDYPDWKRDTNFTDWKWMEDVFWIYRARIPDIALASSERLMLKCGGVDYRYIVRIGAKIVYEYEGMFRPFELDLTEGMGKQLTISIFPAPKDPTGDPDTRQEARASAKPAACYGWDWHPRLISCGIWGDTQLYVASSPSISEPEVLCGVSADLSMGWVQAAYSQQGEGEVHFTLEDSAGNEVLAWRGQERAQIKSPALWWCQGYGSPTLYTWKSAFYNKEGEIVSRHSGRIGFRRVQLCPNPGGEAECLDFPKSAPLPSMTITLNNVPIFCKGSNWVAPSPFPGEITREMCEPLLTLARDAHMNILRIWGGCIVNKDFFFDLCDEMGLMVWQEFPLACNCYSQEDEYLKVLDSEAEAIVRRIRRHPSLVLWCGGNELYNDWSGMTDQDLPLRLLNAVCYRLDPSRPFISTSPLPGAGHGPYLFRDDEGRNVLDIIPNARMTAYPEFGVPSISSLETCLMATDRENLEPLHDTPVTRAHHAFGAWGEKTWSCLETLEHYFGPLPLEIEKNIHTSQWLQAQGLRYIFEEARRQKPLCSMAISWCFNEPWPTLANTSMISYPALPKPAYQLVSQSLRPHHVCARIPKLYWYLDETFEAEIWILNDSCQNYPSGVINVSLRYADLTFPLDSWFHPPIRANTNRQGPTVHLPLEFARGTEMELILTWQSTTTRYPLFFVPTKKPRQEKH